MPSDDRRCLRLATLSQKEALEAFVERRCIPAEAVFEEQLGEGPGRWRCVPPVMEELKAEAQQLGLWNLWLPKEFPEGAGLSNSEYAVLAEVTGRSFLAPEACNCSAPDTGNMEVLLRYGSAAQRAVWLAPLLRGEVRSTFLMTEPRVASSDAANIQCTFERLPGGGYRIRGRKWWSSGALDPRCKVAIVMGRVLEDGLPDDTGGDSGGGGGGGGGDGGGVRLQVGEHPKKRAQTMLLVPMDAPGVSVVRALTVFGYDDAPHGHAEVALDGVEVMKYATVTRSEERREKSQPVGGSFSFALVSSRALPHCGTRRLSGWAGGAARGRRHGRGYRAGAAGARPRAPLYAHGGAHGSVPRPRR